MGTTYIHFGEVLLSGFRDMLADAEPHTGMLIAILCSPTEAATE